MPLPNGITVHAELQPTNQHVHPPHPRAPLSLSLRIYLTHRICSTYGVGSVPIPASLSLLALSPLSDSGSALARSFHGSFSRSLLLTHSLTHFFFLVGSSLSRSKACVAQLLSGIAGSRAAFCTAFFAGFLREVPVGGGVWGGG